MQIKVLVIIFSILFVSSIEAGGKGKAKGKETAPGQLKKLEKGKATAPGQLKKLAKDKDEASSEEKEWTCNGEEIETSEEQKKIHKECLKASDNNKEDPCYTACVSEGFKIVVDGKLDTEAVNKWIETALPEDVQEEAKKENEACAKETTEPLTKDDKCKSYSKLMACQASAYMKLCKAN